MTKMGSGTHTYEVTQEWCKLPEGVKFGFTHGVVVDRHDNVYIFNMSKDAVVAFDREGNFLKSWGEQFEKGAHGFYLHREGEEEYLYLTDINAGKMVKTTLDGRELLSLSAPDLPEVYSDEKKYKPTDVAVAPNGDIYVTDGYGQCWIHQYNSKGEHIRSWGGKGSEPGQMKCPHGISIDLRHDEPEIYVADRGNNRIQVFTMDGVHKRFITADMDMPCNFYYFGDELYFPDLHSRVTIFDGQDRLITHLGEDSAAFKQEGWPNLPESYFRTDKFSSPHGICVDSRGDVYLAEWINRGRISKLTRQ